MIATIDEMKMKLASSASDTIAHNATTTSEMKLTKEEVASSA